MSGRSSQSEYGSLMQRILDLEIKINNLDTNDPEYSRKKKELSNQVEILESQKNYRFGRSAERSTCTNSSYFSIPQPIAILSSAGRTEDSHPQVLPGIITSNPFASDRLFRIGYQ